MITTGELLLFPRTGCALSAEKKRNTAAQEKEASKPSPTHPTDRISEGRHESDGKQSHAGNAIV